MTSERIRLKQLIDRDLDALYDRASGLGTTMGKLFKEGNRSQLRNLEAVAAAATRTSALKNHIKNQTGKDRLRRDENQTWARPDSSLGQQTLKLLDELGGRAAAIVKKAEIKDSEEALHELARTVEIELQRGLVQTAVSAALYGDLEAES